MLPAPLLAASGIRFPRGSAIREFTHSDSQAGDPVALTGSRSTKLRRQLTKEDRTINELALDDLQVAAFFHKGFRLVRTEGPAYRKMFIFADVPNSVVQEFYAGTAEVNARKLFDSYRTLRAMARQSFAQERIGKYHVFDSSR